MNSGCKTSAVSADTIILATGERLLFRALQPEDREILGDFFVSLSDETRRRYSPHPFTREQAEVFCTRAGSDKDIRFLAVTEYLNRPQAAAYVILHSEPHPDDAERYRKRGTDLTAGTVCSIAPCVADAWQGKGLGSKIVIAVLAAARRLGKKQAILAGGTQATNSRAIRMYTKCGFRQVGSFMTSRNNFDMITDLALDRIIRSNHEG